MLGLVSGTSSRNHLRHELLRHLGYQGKYQGNWFWLRDLGVGLRVWGLGFRVVKGTAKIGERGAFTGGKAVLLAGPYSPQIHTHICMYIHI